MQSSSDTEGSFLYGDSILEPVWLKTFFDVATALCRRVRGCHHKIASTERGGYNIVFNQTGSEAA